ncbi:MAG: hypothetical protein IKW96_08315 [Ruminococcus sp.]|uniref:hypothetical protein n=1 Tax=Ruminococcus sp. TaxID=41978 RepID=UPI0025F2CE09|nr:hypothetical protein [Ruminococcus sp.]MBR5683267.1 hypothetical protein [Ruminococcus sp.]
MKKKKIISAAMALTIVAAQSIGGVPENSLKANAFGYGDSILSDWLQDVGTGTNLNSYLESSYLKSVIGKINDLIRRMIKNEPQEKFVDGADNWSFSNSSENFGDTYFMGSEYWNKLMDGLKNTEKERIINNVKYAPWAGSCYGMATTSVLASRGVMQPDKWQSDAASLHDIAGPPTNDVKSLINYYFALQFTDHTNQRMALAVSGLEPVKLLKLIKCLEDGSPTLLCFYGYFNRMYLAGHAVVAYDVEYGTYVKNGKKYNGKILIYDNNSVDYDEDFCLYFSTTDGSWTIPVYELSSDYDDYLGLVTDDIDLINYHGYIDGSDEPTFSRYIATLQSAQIKGNYKLVKESDKNVYCANSTSSDDDIKLVPSLADYDFKNSSIMFALNDSSSSYVLNVQTPEELDLSMSYENSLLKANASSGSEAKFSPADSVSVSGKNTDYDLKIVLNDGEKVTDWYSFSVKGSGVDDATLTKEDNGYVLEASNLNDVKAFAYNDDVRTDVTFSTEYTKVFLFEKDENTIGVAVDTDNNGSFETEIK